MKSIWPFCIFLIIFMLSTFGNVFAVQEIVFLCDEAYQPYCFAEGNIAKGIYVDILEEAFKDLPEYKLIIRPVPWKRGLEMVKKGKALAIFHPYNKNNDRPWFDYAVPILKEEVVLLHNKKSYDPALKWPQDFTNKKIGINLGFSILDNTQKKSLHVEEAVDTYTNIKKLVNNQIDVYVNGKYCVLYEFSSLIVKDNLAPAPGEQIFIGQTIGNEMSYIAFTKENLTQYNYINPLTHKLIKILHKMQNQHKFETIIRKWVIE